MSEEGTPIDSSVALPIEWHVPEGLITRYASNIVVQRTASEYFISFFDVTPPILIGTPQDVERQMKQLGKIKAVCVARIVVGVERFAEFVKVMQDQVEAVQKAQDKG